MIAAMRIVSSTARPAGTPSPFKSLERTIPERASNEPTERSIPPVSTTNVIPIETTQRIDELVSRFSRFAWVKKVFCVAENQMKSAVSKTRTAA